MKQTFYLLRNNSGSEGSYLLNGEYKTIYPGEKIDLKSRPTNVTSNIIISIYRKETKETPILNLKTKAVNPEKRKKNQ
jgi:hypothetical protein